MNQSMNQIPKSGAIPMQVDVKIHTLHTSGSVLASASVNLNGCFAIRGVKVVDSPKGPFVSMPSYQGRKGYTDVCFPCTKEFRQQFNDAVLDAYQQEMAQVFQRSQCQEPNGTFQEEPDDSMLPDMAM